MSPTTLYNFIMSFNTDTGRNFAININRADNSKTDPDEVQAGMDAIRATGVLVNVHGLPTSYRHAILRSTTRTPIV